MKRMLYAILVLVFFSISSSASGIDLSGNWVLTDRNPSMGIRIPNISMSINQTGNDLMVTRNLADEEKTIEAHYTLDGAENTNIEPNAAGPVTIRSTSKWNSRTLVLEGSSTFEGPDKNVTREWKREYLLSEDGTSLTVTETIPTPFGNAVVALVFARK